MRRGIVSAGNFIIDHVKTISHWPERGMLADILDEQIGSGGGAYNVLIDLAKMEADLPLYAVGIIGQDSDGDAIEAELEGYEIRTDFLLRTSKAPTSYTDVMAESGGRSRTFFHCRGANSMLDVAHFEGIDCEAKIFYLGYLLLLDRLDAPDPDLGARAARVLKMMADQGFLTAVDLVSIQNRKAPEVVCPCLPFIDYLIINEIEAGNVTGFKIRSSDQSINVENLKKAVRALIDQGVRKLAVIHFPEGAFAMLPGHKYIFEPSFEIATEDIRGATGAGDAFCAGLLYCLHENKP
ncbi:MAG: carbohydrate kinase family protein, partial [bacterium]|nr:carbohydrate kinase family protein [bacterium]